MICPCRIFAVVILQYIFRFTAILCLILSAVHSENIEGNLCPGLRKCFCNEDLTSVNCEGQHFTYIPKCPETTEKLYLAYNDLTNIPSHAFTGLPNLQKLFLDHNKITAIHPYAFEGLESLADLYLQKNKITALVNNSLSNIPRLSHLDLTANKILSIANDAFSGTSSLEYASLQSNNLSVVPPLGNQPHLDLVILGGNRIVDATFPSSYLNCSRNISIILSSNDIKALTNSTFLTLANSRISKFYLSRNNIKSVEAGAFSGLSSILSLKIGLNPLDSISLKKVVAGLTGKNVKYLDISGITQAGVLMEELFSLLQNTNLKYLIMRNNGIKILRDNTFSYLNSLVTLDLSHSQIVEAKDEAFNGLEHNLRLKLNKNMFATIPKYLPSSLRLLYLDNNQLKTIPSNIFSNLVQLQELRMNNNHIVDLGAGAFNGLVKLEKIDLHNNNIPAIPGSLFSSLLRLKNLNLGKNKLMLIPNFIDRLMPLPSLQYLNLADNMCAFVRSDFFNAMKSLKYLHIEQNNFGKLIAEDYDGQLFEGLAQLEHIYLMNNNIGSLPDSIFKNQLSLTLLNVSHNKLSGWGPHLFKPTQTLLTLDISFNLITTLKQVNFQYLENLKYLHLTGSPFLCNCDLRWFRQWLDTTKTEVSNKASYTCHGPNDWRSEPLLAFSGKKIECLFFTKYAIIGATLGGLVMALLSGILVYKNRWRLRLRWYCFSRRGRRVFGMKKANDAKGNYGTIEGTLTYDAYVSCSDMDTHWALQNLLPGIDNGRLDEEFGGEFRLYYEDRDSDPSKLANSLDMSQSMLLDNYTYRLWIENSSNAPLNFSPLSCTNLGKNSFQYH